MIQKEKKDISKDIGGITVEKDPVNSNNMCLALNKEADSYRTLTVGRTYPNQTEPDTIKVGQVSLSAKLMATGGSVKRVSVLDMSTVLAEAVLSSEAAPNQWFTLEILLDLDDETYDIYVDGNKTTEEPIAFDRGDGGFNSVQFEIEGSDEEDALYIDDVTIMLTNPPALPMPIGSPAFSDGASYEPAILTQQLTGLACPTQYWVNLPPGYDPNKTYPIFMYNIRQNYGPKNTDVDSEGNTVRHDNITQYAQMRDYYGMQFIIVGVASLHTTGGWAASGGQMTQFGIYDGRDYTNSGGAVTNKILPDVFRSVKNYVLSASCSDRERTQYWGDCPESNGAVFDQQSFVETFLQVKEQYGGEDKFYIDGHSSSGHSFWNIVMNYPEFIAAGSPSGGNYQGNIPERMELTAEETAEIQAKISQPGGLENLNDNVELKQKFIDLIKESADGKEIVAYGRNAHMRPDIAPRSGGSDVRVNAIIGTYGLAGAADTGLGVYFPDDPQKNYGYTPEQYGQTFPSVINAFGRRSENIWMQNRIAIWSMILNGFNPDNLTLTVVEPGSFPNRGLENPYIITADERERTAVSSPLGSGYYGHSSHMDIKLKFFDDDARQRGWLNSGTVWPDEEIYGLPVIIGKEVSASVTNIGGNKNELTISIVEQLLHGKAINTITETFSTGNNPAGTYEVGEYKVYIYVTANNTITAQFTEQEPDNGNNNSGGSSGGSSRAPASSSAISPNKASFDLNDVKDLIVTLTLNGNTLRGLKNGNAALKQGTDYTVSGNTVTIKAAYLTGLSAGGHTISFDMSGGTNPKLAITITGAIADIVPPLPEDPVYKPMQPLHSAGTKVDASKTNNPLLLDGNKTVFPAVKIGDYNWIKLRDFAMLLRGSAKQFSVGYDASTAVIDIRTGQAYQSLGDELSDNLAEIESAIASMQRLRVNGEFAEVAAYNIKGYNYFRVRDLAIILNFAVIYDEESGEITLDFTSPYKE